MSGPSFSRVAGGLFINVAKFIRNGVKHLAPIIEERKRKIEGYGTDYPDGPVSLLCYRLHYLLDCVMKQLNMFSWLLDEARANELSTENLTRRILLLNFAGIHMSSSFCIISPFGTHVIYSFTNALYDLASRLDYIEPILQEIEAVLVEEGWSKVAMTRVRKLDISIVFWRSRKGWLVFIPVSTAFVHTFCVS